MDRKYRIKAGDELSILRLYVHILTIIREFKPTKIPRSYVLSKDGKTFVIGAKAAAEMLLGKSGGSVATGEALEILEYQRRYALALKNKPLEVGNLDFTLGLTEFAILVRQNGERLPWEKGDLDRFIQERREFFKDLPLDEVLSIRFFFAQCIAYVQKKSDYRLFWKPREATAKEKRSKYYQAQKLRAEELWELVGFRSFYDIAVRERWYDGTEINPFASVFYSNFEDFVSKIAIRNGRA